MPNEIIVEMASAGEIVVEISGMTYGSVEAELALVSADITALETGKADKSYTDAQLALKTDQTYTDTQLALVSADITALETGKADKATTYTKTEVDTKDGLLVPKTTTINTKALSGNISLTAADVPNTPAGGIAATNVQTALNELDTEKANKVQEGWNTPTLLNGWAAVNGTPQYMKDSMGFVHFRGGVNGAASTTTAPFTLPPGYRPNSSMVFSDIKASNFAQISASGIMAIDMGHAKGWMALSQISYLAEG